MAADVFISYAREDLERVRPLVSAIEGTGYSVFWDRKTPAGMTWRQYIGKALDDAKCVVVVWSKSSIVSDWVIEEADDGKERGILIPVQVDDVKPPLGFRSLQHEDLRDWDGDPEHRRIKSLLSVLESNLEVITNPKDGYELVKLPGESFMMGSPESEEDRFKSEGPQHEVQVPAFYIGRYPVTNAQYQKFLEANPQAGEPEYWADRDLNQPQQPVVGVSWKDAQAYARWAGLRLPSEAEWEYACRAGTTARFYTGDKETDLDRAGWYGGNSGGRLHPVGEKAPNAFGLYDMHGNVDEWVEDDWHDDYKGAPEDGSAWADNPRGTLRVFRGGGWGYVARYCRSATRVRIGPCNRNYDLGFRLSRSVTLGPWTLGGFSREAR